MEEGKFLVSSCSQIKSLFLNRCITGKWINFSKYYCLKNMNPIYLSGLPTNRPSEWKR